MRGEDNKLIPQGGSIARSLKGGSGLLSHEEILPGPNGLEQYNVQG